MDITQLVFDGAKCLEVGQLLKSEHITLRDTVYAIELMNPKMDRGVMMHEETKVQAAIEKTSATPLTDEDALCIADGLLASMMAHHYGEITGTNVMGCLYLQKPMTVTHVWLKGFIVEFLSVMDAYYDVLERLPPYTVNDYSEEMHRSYAKNLDLCRDLTETERQSLLNAAWRAIELSPLRSIFCARYEWLRRYRQLLLDYVAILSTENNDVCTQWEVDDDVDIVFDQARLDRYPTYCSTLLAQPQSFQQMFLRVCFQFDANKTHERMLQLNAYMTFDFEYFRTSDLDALFRIVTLRLQTSPQLMPIVRATIVARLDFMLAGCDLELYQYVQPALNIVSLSSSRMRRKLLRYVVDTLGPITEKGHMEDVHAFQCTLISIVLAEGFRQDLYPPELYATICWMMSHFAETEHSSRYYRNLSLFFLSANKEGPHSDVMYANLFRKLFSLKDMQPFSWRSWLKWRRTQLDAHENTEAMRKEALHRITLVAPSTPQDKSDFYALKYEHPLTLPTLHPVPKSASTYP